MPLMNLPAYLFTDVDVRVGKRDFAETTMNLAIMMTPGNANAREMSQNQSTVEDILLLK